jgi:hypothetical protein
MSARNIVWLANASCWLTIHGGKNVRQPSVFKITQQHTNNWETNILLTQCIVFLVFHLGMNEFIVLFQMTNDTM